MNVLENKHIAFLGAGNMGGALIHSLKGLARQGLIAVFDPDMSKTGVLTKKTGALVAVSAPEAVKNADIVVLAVKPDRAAEVCGSVSGALKKETLFVSIAAGVSTAALAGYLGGHQRLVRAMPNTPLLVKEGMTVLSSGMFADESDLETAEKIFSSCGKTLTLPEKLMDAVTGLSGSGPAYVLTFIQALADGGVKQGIPRDKAVLLASQTVLGTARLALQTGGDPISLRGKVTSPGGTTIEGVHVMERAGFSGIVMDAVEAAALKSKKLGES